MSRRWLLLLVGLLLVALVADARPRKRKRSKEDRALDAEESKALIDAKKLEAPGLIRWFESFLIPRAQLKITRVDTSAAPELTVHFSLLHWDRESRLIQAIRNPEVLKELELRMAAQDQRTPEPLVTFGADGQVKEGPAAKLQPISGAGVPLDVVIVAAGHRGLRQVEQMEPKHRAAVQALIAELPDARMNIIWYGAMLHTYRSFEGISGEFSRFDEDLKQCNLAWLKYKIDSKKEREEGEEAPLPPPCGLHEGKGGELKAAITLARFRGKHANLFGLGTRGLNPASCTTVETTSTALRHFDLDELEQRTLDGGAFEEALRMLVRYGRPEARKALIVLSDGRDGFLDDDAECRRLFTSDRRYCADAADGLRGKKARQAIQTCVQQKLNDRSTKLQERFAVRAANWITLARAAGVRVYSLAYGSVKTDETLLSYPWERERLELLALKTGGTYREVLRPATAENSAKAIARELNSEFVLQVRAGLESEQPYTIELKATVEDGKGDNSDIFQVTSPEVEFTTPFVGSGFWYWLGVKNAWLKKTVGPILYWVILVAAALLALFFLWLLFKLIKAMVMKIVGLFVKKGKAAAKGAAKGAKGAAKAAGKSARGGK